MPAVVKPRVPDALLVRCHGEDARAWNTTRDIIATAQANAGYLKACALQVDKIREWNGE